MSYLITPKIKKAVLQSEKKVSELFDVPILSLYNRSRDYKSARARFAVFYLLYKVHKLPYQLIADLYKMHFSSVKYGIESAEFYELPAEMGLKNVDKS